jgi:hypothetical protein
MCTPPIFEKDMLIVLVTGLKCETFCGAYSEFRPKNRLYFSSKDYFLYHPTKVC